MRSFFHPRQTTQGPTSMPSPAPIPPQTTEERLPTPTLEDGGNTGNEDIFVGYLSDESTDEESDSEDDDTGAMAHTGYGSGTVGTESAPAVPTVEPASESLPVDFNVRLGPQRKRRKLDVPAHVLHHHVKEEWRQGQKKALDDIEKLMEEKHNECKKLCAQIMNIVYVDNQHMNDKYKIAKIIRGKWCSVSLF